MSNENLPKAVRDQLAEAEKIEAELTGAAAPQPPAPEPEPAPATPEPPPAPEVPPTPVQPEVVPPAPVQPPAAVTEETWEQRYKTLKGIHDADNARHRGRIGELETQLAAAEAKAAKAPAPTPTPPTDLPGVTAKEIEDFGPELIDVIKRAAAQVSAEQNAALHGTVSRLEAELAAAKERLGGVATRQGLTDHEKFVNALRGEVPDADVVNADEGWLLWLAQPDPLSGVKRQALLDDAAGKFDHMRVANIFKQFKSDTGYVSQAPAPPAAPAPATPPAPAAPPAPPVSVTPPSNRAPTPPPAQSGQRTFSQAEIKAFYADVTKGLYRGREAEAAALEAEIDAAVLANRVTA